MNNIQVIQEWYKNQCDGDWEHSYGIKIETIDNPGWSVKIDLVETSLESFTYHEEADKGNNDWLIIKSDGKVFSGLGDFNKLNSIFDKFINSFGLPNIKKSTYTYIIYEALDFYSQTKVYRPIEAKMINMIEFEIISIPDFDSRDLKVLEVNDFEKLNFEQLDKDMTYKIGDIVKCDLINFYDYPSLVIVK